MGVFWGGLGVVSVCLHLGRPGAQKVRSMSVIVMHNKHNKQAKPSSKQVSQSVSQPASNILTRSNDREPAAMASPFRYTQFLMVSCMGKFYTYISIYVYIYI